MNLTYREDETLNDDDVGTSRFPGEKKVKDSKKLIKECQWIIYTIVIYLCFLEGVVGAAGVVAFVVINFNDIKNSYGSDTEEAELRKDIMIVFFLFWTQMAIFWYGILARKELTFDAQERFKNFMKAYLNLLLFLTLLFGWYCVQRNQIFSDDGIRKPSDYVLYVAAGQNFLMRLVEGRAAYLAKCFKKSEAETRYKQGTPEGENDHRVQL